MFKVSDKLVVKDEQGVVTQTVPFHKLVLGVGELSRMIVGIGPENRRPENDTEYATRIEQVIKDINENLAGWSGRHETVKIEKVTNVMVKDQTGKDVMVPKIEVQEISFRCKGAEGALNMGDDLALRQVNRPQPLTPARINDLNRKAALSWAAAEAFKPDGKVSQERLLKGIANADKLADELINEFPDQIPGLK